MRTDPTIQSVLAAYITPLLAARWQIDPRGASPAIVKVCADSLGLPVAGVPDEPGAMRRRGVTWREHMRLAALHLLYGHMPFEPVYEIRDGSAYLARLPERMPHTIQEITTTRDGDLKTVTQYVWGDKQRQNGGAGIVIPADRLLWYVNDREGSNWQGRSLLRSAYASWLLKIEALRTNAIGLDRFSAGTPVAEPVPGTNPTSAQVMEAARMVASVRVGQSGGAVPVGFALKIKGVEGTLPDSLATIRYYDEQMARASLTSLLDLGSTANGSRALGSEFADVMARALQSIAERVAETATGLCERLTTFNEGDDANVPAVVAGSVGADPATTAQAIAGLVQAGAIAPDPALEAWMRDAYGLPAKVETPEHGSVAPGGAPEPGPVSDDADANANEVAGKCNAPTQSGDPCKLDAGEGTPHPGEGKCYRHERQGNPVAAAAAQQGAYREPTDAETQAGVDPQAVDDAQDALTTETLAAVTAVLLLWGATLTPLIVAALAAGRLADMARVALPDGAVTDMVDVLAVAALAAGDAGAVLVAGEAAGGSIDRDARPDPDVLTDAAEAAAVELASWFAGVVTREAARLAGPDADPGQVAADAVAHALNQTVAPHGAVVSVITRGIGAGRAAAFASLTGGWVFFHSAIRDKATCGPCLDHDGHQYADLTEAVADFPAGPYAACLGRYRCRCLIAARPEDV
jgi:hypothetical protein